MVCAAGDSSARAALIVEGSVIMTAQDPAGGSARMPAAFFGHGNPMNALETNRYTAAWRAFGDAVPRPRAVLVISAHWYVNANAGPPTHSA